MGVGLRVPVRRLESGDLTLDPEASRYIARVHRLRQGDPLLLFHPGDAREADAVIVEIGRAVVRCRVGDVRAARIRAPRPVTLLQAAGKGDKLDAIVRDATELGATGVVVVDTRRSIVRFRDKGEERIGRLRRVAVEAARQCGRGDAPDISGPLPWDVALRRAADESALRLCLWERATEPAGAELVRLGVERSLVVAAGPEGGLEEAEIDVARSFGFAIVSLGPFILRTETVAAAVLGAALLLQPSKITE
jgi:16S rRNA (uracil1498-N3)-methyltransferase